MRAARAVAVALTATLIAGGVLARTHTVASVPYRDNAYPHPHRRHRPAPPNSHHVPGHCGADVRSRTSMRMPSLGEPMIGAYTWAISWPGTGTRS